MSSIEPTWARAFAEEWIAAWNSSDLERILSHYRDDFEMSSPLIIERMGEPSGVLRGKDAIRRYWEPSVRLVPPLCFELIEVYAGIDCIVIHYRSIGRRVVVEVLTLDDQRRVIRGAACWCTTATQGAPLDPATP